MPVLKLFLYNTAIMACLVAAATAQQDYSPSAVVRLTHRTPHLSPGLQRRDGNFALDSESASDLRSSSYGRSLIVLPVIIGCTGLLVGIIFMISIISRICFKTCRFEPDRDEVKGVTKQALREWTKKHIARRERQQTQFFVYFALALAAIHVAYVGNQYLTLGFQSAVDSINFVADIFDVLDAQGGSLKSDGVTLAEGLARARTNCSEVSAAESYLKDYDVAVEEYNEVVGPVPERLDSTSKSAREYGLVRRNLSMYCIYAGVVLILVIYAVSYFFAWRSMMALVTVLNLVGMFLLLILCVFEMILVMISADFCMDPAQYSVQLAPPGGIHDNLAYYLTCNGTSPAGPAVDDAREYARLLNNTLAELTTTTCPGNEDLIALYSTTASVDTSLSIIEGLLPCPPLRTELQSLLFGSLCEDTFLGLYLLWVCQYTTVLFLFLLCVIGSVIHNFFGAFWHVNLDDVSQLDQASKRHQAVEKALQSHEFHQLEDSEHSEEDEDEDFHRSPGSPFSGENVEAGEIRVRPLELEEEEARGATMIL